MPSRVIVASADRLIELFNEAKAKPAGAERERFLTQACGDDSHLKEQVLSLLQAEAERGDSDFLKGTPLIRQTALVTEKPGDRIGRYKLLQQLGEGGCGVVYMAEQEEPVRRRVALKVIKLGMDTKSVIARFEAERQALALMDHPNIAKVFDAGATETGRPFFVMEPVRGTKITDYCDQNNLSTGQRLELFTQVCHAVQHAHQKGIIHRDLKPSNILVTLHDGVPVPKVIDFGVAKATSDQRLTDKTVFTAFEQFIGTPAYMSPEQAEMSGLDIDTRSDIYSLGVLLYELLTGRTPLDPDELLRSGMNEMRRKIREDEPPRPSTRLSTMQAVDLTTIAKHRQADAPKLIHLVHGDLDWIVMKCLEKDRTRRYETANGLARDIERHLHDEPIAARPPARLYRFRKLVQRNKLAFVAVGVLAVALLIVVIGSLVAAWRVDRARRAEQVANRDLRQTVNLLELGRAEDFFNANDSAAGVAHLAAMLRRNPSNSIAANRLVSALVHRSWAVPSTPQMRHADRVTMASFSPDGRHVLSASWDKTACTWDASTGQPIFKLGHEERVVCARYSPDGDRVVTASASGTAQIWDATTGERRTQPLQHEGKVNWAEFSADGRWVVTASDDKTARIWDASSGALKRELRAHISPVLLARFSPDGQRVATGGRSIRIWDVDSGETLFCVEDHLKPLTALAFSPDGQRLMCACEDGVVKVWNAASGESSAAPLMHRLVVWYAEFSPDTKLLLTACEDGAARLWDVQTLRMVGGPLRHESGVIFGQFSPDGQRVVTTSSDYTARVWDVRTQTPVCQPLRHVGHVLQASFSPDGRRLVTASYDGTAQVWDLRDRFDPGTEIHHDVRVVPFAFTSDGAALLTGAHDKAARVWDTHTGQALTDPIRHDDWISAAAFAPDGRRMVTASRDGSIRVWDYGDWKSASNRMVASPRLVAGPFGHSNRVLAVRFSTDGSRLATASADGTARVWDAISGQPIAPSLVHSGAVVMAQFSRDGRMVVTASEDHTARVWDAQSGHPVTEPLVHRDHVLWAEFSPDSERVATASTDDTACIWNVRMGRRIVPPLLHPRIVRRAVFSPDGRWVATASLDRKARIWDSSTGQALTPPLPHDSFVEKVFFTPDGQRLVTVSVSGVARFWDSNTGRPLTEWLNAGSYWGACFDPGAERIAVGTTAGIVHIWKIPRAPTPVPEWFPRFAEAVAGIRLGERGNVELVPRQTLKDFARQIPTSATNNEYEQLAQRFLADSN